MFEAADRAGPGVGAEGVPAVGRDFESEGEWGV